MRPLLHALHQLRLFPRLASPVKSLLFRRPFSPPDGPELDPAFDPRFLDGKGPAHVALVLRHLTHHPPPPGTRVLLLPVLRSGFARDDLCRLPDVPPPEPAER